MTERALCGLARQFRIIAEPEEPQGAEGAFVDRRLWHLRAYPAGGVGHPPGVEGFHCDSDGSMRGALATVS